MADPTSVVQAQIFHKLKQRFTHVPDEHIREVMFKVCGFCAENVII